MPPIKIGNALTLNDIRICASAITIIGSHDWCDEYLSLDAPAVVVMPRRTSSAVLVIELDDDYYIRHANLPPLAHVSREYSRGTCAHRLPPPAKPQGVRKSRSKPLLMLQIETSGNTAKRSLILRGIAAVLLGIVLLIWPSSSVRILIVVFVSYACVDGIISLVAAVRNANAGEPWIRRAIESAVALVSALVVGLWPHVVLTVLGFLIGFALLARGIVQIVSLGSPDLPARARPWLVTAGLLSLIAGAIFIFSPRTGLYLFVWTLAVYGLVFGAILIVLGIQAQPAANDPV
jgi:uncharacterized membrane protein HdeD (DUF308 family)